MDKNNIKTILDLLLTFKPKYDNFLKSYNVDKAKFEGDSRYALTTFFNVWGLERSQAPKKQKIATVKFLYTYFDSLHTMDDAELERCYREFLSDGINAQNNPVLHQSIAGFNVPNLISAVKENKIEAAYAELIALNGIGHKIASFFLRDASYFFTDKKEIDLQQSAYFFPVDIWVRQFINALAIADYDTADIQKPQTMQNNDFTHCAQFCALCTEFGFDIRVMNFCIWYFCSNYVGNIERLEYLLRKGASAVQAEIDLFDKALGL